MKKIIFLFIIAVLMVVPSFSEQSSDFSVFQITLYDDIAMLPIKNVYGLAINILHGSLDNMSGFDVGLSQNVNNKMAGLQLAVLFNTAKYFSGVQVGVLNYGGTMSQFSIQAGVVNLTAVNDGFQIGFLNNSDGYANIQAGVWNNAGNNGLLQVGLINFSNSDLDGAQIGLLNFGPNWFFPIINWNPKRNVI